VLIRYNLNNFIGIGAGIQANINSSEKQEQKTKVETFENEKEPFVISTEESATETNRAFTNLKTGVLFDLTVGGARIGPSLGARYVLNFKENFNYFQFYGIWKF
jgi:hypothetical protein